MTLLGITSPTEAEQDRAETTNAKFRVGIARNLAKGGGVSIGAAVLWMAFSILKADPKDAFPLLEVWGPKAVGTIVVIYVVYDVVKIVLNLVSRMVRSVEKMAVAQQKLADKDDRQVQEMQTLTAYTAQQSEKMYGKMVNLAEKIEALTQAIQKGES